MPSVPGLCFGGAEVESALGKWASLVIFFCALGFALVTYFAPHAVARSLKSAALHSFLHSGHTLQLYFFLR